MTNTVIATSNRIPRCPGKAAVASPSGAVPRLAEAALPRGPLRPRIPPRSGTLLPISRLIIGYFSSSGLQLPFFLIFYRFWFWGLIGNVLVLAVRWG
jgi:hypothetical protein